MTDRVDPAGKPFRRYFQLETLRNAIEFHVRTRDRFLLRSIEEGLGAGEVTSLAFSLERESNDRLWFRVDASNAVRRRGSFALIVTKDSEEGSPQLAREHAALAEAYKRIPELVARPFLGGTFFLPDRYGRKSKDRDLFAYMTRWEKSDIPLTQDRAGRVALEATPPQLLRKALAEALRGEIAAMVMRSYNMATGNCMEMPEIYRAEVAVTAGFERRPSVRLLACRGFTRRLPPAAVIDLILAARWHGPSGAVDAAPEDPHTLQQAVIAARGETEGGAWLRAYASAVKRGKLPMREPGYFEVLVTDSGA